MSKSRDRRPPLVVEIAQSGLRPVLSADAEMLCQFALGTQFDLIPRTKRSLPQLRLYWSTLSQIVKATGKWPSPEHLHHELKLICGFRMTIVDWQTGEASVAVDSTAFDQMGADEFRVYFDLAMEKLSEHLGFDPLAFLPSPSVRAEQRKAA